MPVMLEENESSRVIRLEGSVNIVSAAELKSLLTDALSTGGPLSIRLEQVTDLDVCIVQLLVAAVREWKQIGAICTLLGPLNKDLLVAMTDAGFEPLPVMSGAGVLSEV